MTFDKIKKLLMDLKNTRNVEIVVVNGKSIIKVEMRSSIQYQISTNSEDQILVRNLSFDEEELLITDDKLIANQLVPFITKHQREDITVQVAHIISSIMIGSESGTYRRFSKPTADKKSTLFHLSGCSIVVYLYGSIVMTTPYTEQKLRVWDDYEGYFDINRIKNEIIPRIEEGLNYAYGKHSLGVLRYMLGDSRPTFANIVQFRDDTFEVIEDEAYTTINTMVGDNVVIADIISHNEYLDTNNKVNYIKMIREFISRRGILNAE